MDPVERFAAAATDFERWLVTGTDQGPDAARAALMHLLKLYACGLELPDAWSGDIDKEGDVERLTEQELRKAKAACARLPLDYYNDVFNPVDLTDATPVAKSLAGDLADIYGDVVRGLRAYELGNPSGAAWEWSFHLHAHWGNHATSAIRALHWWLADNAIDRLSSPPSISALVTFLTPQQGGRSQNAYDSPDYQPHIVIGDPNQAVALIDATGLATEDYLGVQFMGDARELPAGAEHLVTLGLMYVQDVDYSAVVPGATFTIREGGQIVGFGRVVRSPS